jgi:DNA-binding NtrC family response regulator
LLRILIFKRATFIISDKFFSEMGQTIETILLTFTGFQDPYSLGLVGEDEQPGPILSLLSAKPFDKVILFSTPKTKKHTVATRDAITSLYPKVEVEVKDFLIEDPTDYFAILRGLRTQLREIVENKPKTNFFISVSSGTPQMHACWLLLTACGEIPARILNVRPQRFITKDRLVISEVDLTSPEFPVVRSNLCQTEEFLYDSPPDTQTVINQLGIVGDHLTMRKALEISTALAPSKAPILILGETGTGKELIAMLIHQLSGRPLGSFVPLNCSAIPKDLAESILFGHKKGAFTGATSDQLGKFDKADGGTLFLDEIGELPVSTQTKLLRILEDGLIESLGDKRAHKVDVRIIAATNQKLGKAIKLGQFREDLYYRLNVGEIRLPPLRERRSDIPKIALHILDKINRTLKKPKRLTQDALSRLQNYSWPGNVRDLENVLERSARLSKQDIIDADDLMIYEPVTYADPLTFLPEPNEEFSLEGYVTSARKQLILRAIELAKGNQSVAAKLLGITPQAVHKFLRKKG